MPVQTSLANRRLLVVDPDLSVARETARRCERIGFEALAANRSSQALELYLQKLPAVVLVEMLLPDGNGLDLIREIRTYDWSHASRIYLHTFIRGSVEIVGGDARRAGATGLFAKPFSEGQLTELVGPASAAPDRSGLPLPEGPVPSSEAPTRAFEDAVGARTRVATSPQTRVAGDAPVVADRGAGGLGHDLVDLDGADEPPIEIDTSAAGYELDLGEDELGSDTELDAWLEGLTKGREPATRSEAVTRPVGSAPTEELSRRGSSAVRSWTPQDGRISTVEGALGRDTLLAILAAAWREDWFGRVRIEAGRLWTELAVGEGRLWTVTCDETGPSIVDVGFRHGLLAAKDLGLLSQALRERGERAAARVLAAAGVREAGVERILELTATERVMTAFESKEGAYRCRANLPPTSESFEARLPLAHLVSLAVDRHVPVMRAVDRYAGREQEVLRKTPRFDGFVGAVMTDRFSRDALGNFVDGETLLDWIQRNPSNPGALFLLLTKLEEVGALLVGRAIGPPAFSFGEEERTDSSRTGATIPATPKQTSRRIAEISDNPLLVEAASSPGAGEAASARGDSAGWDSDFEEEPSEDDGDLEPPSPTADLPDVGLLDDSPLAGEASPGLEPVLEGYLEGAGFAASLHRLRTTGEQESVEEDSWEEGAGWRESVHRFLDRGDWDAARRELQTRLIEAPEDTEAAAFEAWLAFSRAVEGGPSSTGEALAELERVLEAAPSCGATYHLLGLAALTLGNPKQARAHFDRGLEAVPEDRAMLVATALVRTGYYDHPRADLSPAGVWRLTRKLAK